MQPPHRHLPAETQPSLPDLQGAVSRRSHLPRNAILEANLIRYPLFAITTKGLSTLDGIECRGKSTRDGETHEFVYTVTRNTATMFPGLLSRATHLALMSVITESGLPVENPLSFSWYDLCRRMGTTASGKMIENIKAAILSTTGILIQSKYAIFLKSENRYISNREDALGIYDRVSFAGSDLPDGGKADTNYLWLSGWYVDNLNSLFTAPLDYQLWRWLDERSPIASRLYEFLIRCFYSGTPVLKINYETLTQYLPVKTERYRSKARQQFEPAFQLLQLVGLIEKAIWTDAKTGIAQLNIHRGKTLTPHSELGQLSLEFMQEDLSGAIEVTELRNIKPPDWSLVEDFYRLWQGRSDARPTPKEVEQARELLASYGPRKAKDVVARVVKKLKTEWPDAKTFGAIQKFVPEASDAFDRDERRKEQEQQEQLRRRKEKDEQTRREAERIKFIAVWRPVWESLSEDGRQAIRNSVFTGPNRHLKAAPRLAEKLCLVELARQRGVTVPAEVL